MESSVDCFSDYPFCTPLMVEKATPLCRRKSLEEERKGEADPASHKSQRTDRTWVDSSKTEIVSLPPDSEFTSTDKINENEWNSSQIISRKTKEDVFDVYRRGPRGGDMQQGLDPSQTALCQGAKEKKVFQGLQREATKAKWGYPVSKTSKAFSRIKHSMSYFPRQVGHFAIERHQK